MFGWKLKQKTIILLDKIEDIWETCLRKWFILVSGELGENQI
jgi:hypothetical protein